MYVYNYDMLLGTIEEWTYLRVQLCLAYVVWWTNFKLKKKNFEFLKLAKCQMGIILCLWSLVGLLDDEEVTTTYMMTPIAVRYIFVVTMIEFGDFPRVRFRRISTSSISANFHGFDFGEFLRVFNFSEFPRVWFRRISTGLISANFHGFNFGEFPRVRFRRISTGF